MSKVDIQFHLEGKGIEEKDPNNLFSAPIYRPNTEIRGNVLVYPNEDLRCRKVVVEVLWHTAGRGTRFQQSVMEEVISEGNLMRGVPISADFSTVLPHEPWSFNGRYVSIVWGVKVKVDIPMGRDVELQKNFILAPVRE
ncbi:MAG: hypothetical protein AAF490_12340 [Chloroflexota bacterium]